MLKHLALLIVLGFAWSGYSSDTAAQEVNYRDVNMGSVPAGMLQGIGQDINPGTIQDSPFLFPATPNPNHYPQNGFPHGRSPGYLPGAPLVVLPVPSLMNGMSGFNSMSGFQFPGSYIPQGTPLHRYNGYAVCDPPDLAAGATAGTTGGTTPQRIVKITSTRSPSAPSHPQPCPVYTINGEIQQPKNYTTTITPSIRNAPP